MTDQGEARLALQLRQSEVVTLVESLEDSLSVVHHGRESSARVRKLLKRLRALIPPEKP